MRTLDLLLRKTPTYSYVLYTNLGGEEHAIMGHQEAKNPCSKYYLFRPIDKIKFHK